MDFSFGGHKSLDVVLREIGISGTVNEVRIIIFFCFIDYPGQDPKFLDFSSRTREQIKESVSRALGKQWENLQNNQISLDITETIETGFIRKIGEKYELTRVGQAIARVLYDLFSIASEDYETRKRD